METLRVLVVDDEPGMRMGVQRALRDFSFRLAEADGEEVRFHVDPAETGEVALEKIEAEPPDILLLDHMLPGINGLDVLERVGTKYPDMLTIMITAYASIETAVRATREGAYDFLPKPFTPQELRYAVQKVAGHVVLARRARALAEEKKRVRFEFIRVLGHELKAPLGAVESYLDILDGRTLGDSMDKYGEVIGRSRVRIEQMRKLISDLLDMTKIESGQMQRDPVDLDLRAVADAAVELYQPQAEQRGIAIALHAPEALPFRADRTEMDMIFNNLVSNAVKYNRDGGRVDVTLAREGDTVTLAVADTGIGMSEKDVQKLFGEFVRIRNSKTKNILGSGLGLSILKRLAELYGGDVSVASKEDEGTTFTVVLKDTAESDPSAEASPDAS